MSAIDNHYSARCVRGRVWGQEQNSIGDVFGQSGPSNGISGAHFVPKGLSFLFRNTSPLVDLSSDSAGTEDKY